MATGVKRETIYDEGDNIFLRISKCLHDVGTKIFLLALKGCCTKPLKEILDEVHYGRRDSFHDDEIQKLKTGNESEFDITLMYKFLKLEIHNTGKKTLLLTLERIYKERNKFYHYDSKYNKLEFLETMKMLEDLFAKALEEFESVVRHLLHTEYLAEEERIIKIISLEEIQNMEENLSQTMESIRLDELDVHSSDFSRFDKLKVISTGLKGTVQHENPPLVETEYFSFDMSPEAEINPEEEIEVETIYIVPALHLRLHSE